MGEYNRIDGCKIGEGTVIQSFCNLYGCRIGRDCRIASYVEMGSEVNIGDRCKVGAFSFIPPGVTMGNEVFIGPRVTFTNDRRPRATGDWEIVPTMVEDGASIGAGSVIVCGVTIGSGAQVGAGAVVTHDVAAGDVVVGNPARSIGR